MLETVGIIRWTFKFEAIRNTQHDDKEKQKKNQRLFNLVSILLSLLICHPKVTIQYKPATKNLVFQQSTF